MSPEEEPSSPQPSFERGWSSFADLQDDAADVPTEDEGGSPDRSLSADEHSSGALVVYFYHPRHTRRRGRKTWVCGTFSYSLSQSLGRSSLGRFQSDRDLRTRVLESRVTSTRVRETPLVGPPRDVGLNRFSKTQRNPRHSDDSAEPLPLRAPAPALETRTT